MGVHPSLRGGDITSLPPFSYKDALSSLELDSVSYMDKLPCLPPSCGYSPNWFMESTFIKILLTYEQTLEATSTTYYIWIPLPSPYPQWEAYLHLYLLFLLPKGINVVCKHWILFCLQALIIRRSFTKGGISSRDSLLYMHDVCHNGGVLITPFIHASFFIIHISLFGG